jgi:hypothetical protein
MLVGVDEARHDELSAEINDFFRRLRRNRRRERADPAVRSDRQIEPLRVLGAGSKHTALGQKKRYAAQAGVLNRTTMRGVTPPKERSHPPIRAAIVY